MTLFESIFPQFIQSCAKLHNALVPWSLAILVLAFPFELSRGVDVRRVLLFLTKLFLIVLLTARSYEAINAGQLVVDRFVDQTGLVRPEKIAQTYKERLAATLGEPDVKDQSVLRLLLSGHLLDALLYGFLLIVAYGVLGCITLITFVQQAALLLCWSVTPVLFALLAVEPVAHLGAAHVRRLVAITAWPLGFCVAGTLTDALLNMALADRVLASGSQVLSFAAAIESLIVLGAAGVFDVVSSIMAPVFIHRFLVGNAGPASLVPQSLGSLGAVVLPVLGTSTQRVVEFARSHWPGRVGEGGAADPAVLVPPPPPPPTPPTGAPPSSDPTAALKLARLLNGD